MEKTLDTMIAEQLLQLKAFRVQCTSPIVWANGWKAPIYLDDRKILSYPKSRALVQLELARTVIEQYPDVDVIAGIATNAIAHGVLVAEQLDLPFVYVHPTPKDHGLENQIEGDLRPRQNVVIIENQVNVGANSAKVVEALRDNGCKVLGIVTIFDYQLSSASKKLGNLDAQLISLTDFETVLKIGAEREYFSEEDAQTLRDWHRNPTKWNKE